MCGADDEDSALTIFTEGSESMACGYDLLLELFFTISREPQSHYTGILSLHN